MFCKKVTYTDYDGNERTEKFYFNLTKAEITEMEMSVNGGLTTMVKKIISTKDQPKIVKLFKDLVLKSYGEKSDDGKYFFKSEERSDKFKSTEAYSIIFMELATDADKAADFVNGIIPADLAKEAEKHTEEAQAFLDN